MDDKRQLMASARALEKRGQGKAAGDAFARAGALDEAARVYLAAGHPAEAAAALLRLSGYDPTRPGRVEGRDKAALLKAAICFARAGDTGQAVRLYLALGEKQRAVELLQDKGDVVNAARVEAAQGGFVELVGYAPPAPTSEDQLASARRLEAAGKPEAALDVYMRAAAWSEAARLALGLGQSARAAGYFAAAAMPFEAAECHLRLHERDAALAQLLKVPAQSARYREACAKAIAIAADRGQLSFDLEQLLAPFVRSGPESDAELEVFYRLAILFETARIFDGAAECYAKLLARRPGYRDTDQRLHAALAEERGRSAQDFQRIVEEEQSFRQALQRHATPVLVPPRPVPLSPDDAPLPELPDLPELPELPKVARGAPAPAGGTMRMVTPAPPATAPTGEVAPLHVGLVIANRYRLEKKIGQGGMGEVWAAHDIELDEAVAIKFLNAALVDEETVGRFKQEVSLSRQFAHPNVIRLHDLGSYGENKFITMELLQGQDLGSLLKQGHLPIVLGLDLLVQACRALQVVHDRGVVHRDVKPENFFLTREGILKVMDFGIAKRASAGKGLTRAGTMAGTPHYVAPEQTSDFGGVTHLADVYALGCIAYRMFTGQVPFDAEDVMPILLAHLSQPPRPPRQLNPEIPPELEAVLLRLLAKRPEGRVQSCAELAILLEAIRAGMG